MWFIEELLWDKATDTITRVISSNKNARENTLITIFVHLKCPTWILFFFFFLYWPNAVWLAVFNLCFRVSQWLVKKTIKADSLYSDWMNIYCGPTSCDSVLPKYLTTLTLSKSAVQTHCILSGGSISLQVPLSLAHARTFFFFIFYTLSSFSFFKF